MVMPLSSFPTEYCQHSLLSVVFSVSTSGCGKGSGDDVAVAVASLLQDLVQKQ